MSFGNRRARRRVAAAGMAALLGGVGLATAPMVAQATPSFELTRLFGGTRTETAVAISQDTFPTGAGLALIAADGFANPEGGFADPLAGNYLAAESGSPILLSGQSSVPQATLDELVRLGATDVVLLGGTLALADSVQTQLAAAGYEVGRVFGPNRFGTAAAVAQARPATDVGLNEDGLKTAVVSSGFAFPDALAAGPMVYADNFPQLLTPDTFLATEAVTAMNALGVEHVILTGGTTAITPAVETALVAEGFSVERIFGGDRFATATALADKAIDDLGHDDTNTNVAFARNFPDALAGGPHAGEENSTIVLSETASVDTVTCAFLTARAPTLASGHLFGGTSAVNDATKIGLEECAQGGEEGGAAATTRPELLSASIVGTTEAAEVMPDNPLGTTVQYVFDEDVDGVEPPAGGFRVYDADGMLLFTGIDILDQTGPAVDVLFPVNTDEDAETLTLATVVYDTVTDDQAQVNPEGDVPIGTTETATGGDGGVTEAPDLTDVSGFRIGALPDTAAVDFTFDEDADVLLVAGFSLVLTNGDTTTCTGPVGDTDPSGGTIAGGNGTTEITVICLENPAGTALTAANVARGVVDTGTVEEAGGGNDNGLQAEDVAATSADPDLVSAEFDPADADPDEVTFTFDEDVDVANAPAFFVYYADNSAPANGNATEINAADESEVLVEFGDGDLDGAVGVYVVAGAVNAADSPDNNQDDEVGVDNATSSTRTRGETEAPQLVSVELEEILDGFNNPTGDFEAVYTFDEDLDALVDTSDFHLYLADGTRLTATACAAGVDDGVTTDDDDIVTCDVYDILVGDTPPGAPASPVDGDVVGDATLGTVEYNAVDDGALPNPEGAEVTSGGTGTPAT